MMNSGRKDAQYDDYRLSKLIYLASRLYERIFSYMCICQAILTDWEKRKSEETKQEKRDNSSRRDIVEINSAIHNIQLYL